SPPGEKCMRPNGAGARGRATAVVCLVLIAGALEAAQPKAKTSKLSLDGITLSYPTGWSHQRHQGLERLTGVPTTTLRTMPGVRQRDTVQVTVYTEVRADHAEAVRRLREIELEQLAPASYLTIGGWPALERRHVQPRPQAGDVEAEADAAE